MDQRLVPRLAQQAVCLEEPLRGLAQTLIHKVTGFGDYTLPGYGVTANKLLETNDPPIVMNDGKEFVIRHREYITDIYSGVAGSAGAPALSF